MIFYTYLHVIIVNNYLKIIQKQIRNFIYVLFSTFRYSIYNFKLSFIYKWIF